MEWINLFDCIVSQTASLSLNLVVQLLCQPVWLVSLETAQVTSLSQSVYPRARAVVKNARMPNQTGHKLPEFP